MVRIFSDTPKYYERLRCLRGSVILGEGLIGAGKSTFGKAFVEFLSNNGIPTRFYEEEVNEPLLALFLSDMKKYAFCFQMYMLQNRLKIYRDAIAFAEKENGVAFLDRSLFGDMAFATMHVDSGNITADEWKAYEAALGEAKPRVPTHVLYLEVTSDVALSRIQKRNRGNEAKGYTAEYLEALDMHYKVALEDSDLPIKYLDWNPDRILDDELFLDVVNILE